MEAMFYLQGIRYFAELGGEMRHSIIYDHDNDLNLFFSIDSGCQTQLKWEGLSFRV